MGLFSGNIDEELRHVWKDINERPLFLPFGGKARHPLLLSLGNVKIAEIHAINMKRLSKVEAADVPSDGADDE